MNDTNPSQHQPENDHIDGCLAEYPLGCHGIECGCPCHTPVTVESDDLTGCYATCGQTPGVYCAACAPLSVPPVTPAPPCRQCGPGYRIGDDGCRHTEGGSDV